MQFRIGERDPSTGFYYVIYPDGSQLPNGIKIFNSQHSVGDIVSVCQRSDGMILLDGLKAVDAPRYASIFNVDEEIGIYASLKLVDDNDIPIVPTLRNRSIWSSATKPFYGYANARYQPIITLNRPARRDFRFTLIFTGTATEGVDYTTDGKDFTIPRGAVFFRAGGIYALPDKAESNGGNPLSVIVTLVPQTRVVKIRIRLATATILPQYAITTYRQRYTTIDPTDDTFLNPPVITVGDWFTTVSEKVLDTQANRDLLAAEWLGLLPDSIFRRQSPSFPDPPNAASYTTYNPLTVDLNNLPTQIDDLTSQAFYRRNQNTQRFEWGFTVEGSVEPIPNCNYRIEFIRDATRIVRVLQTYRNTYYGS